MRRRCRSAGLPRAHTPIVRFARVSRRGRPRPRRCACRQEARSRTGTSITCSPYCRQPEPPVEWPFRKDPAPGFLVAVADRLAHAETDSASPNRTSQYVYGGHVYELRRLSTEARALTAIGTERYHHTVESDFQVRNRTTGELTRFQITSGTQNTEGRLAGVPIRVIYRPRWWLELELLLRARS